MTSDDFKRITTDLTVMIFLCADCGKNRVPDAMQALTLPAAHRPCDCGCGWYLIHCQVCGRKIGEGTTAGTVDLS